MRRRDFINGMAGVAATWPLAARAQQSAIASVGYLHGGSPGPYAFLAAALRQGLAEAGYVEGQNVAIEFRWAGGHYDRLPTLATDLVRRQVAVLVAGGLPAAPVAKAATSTIPIVFTSGADPVELGLVASLNRPGGNITGVSLFHVGLDAKRLELLLELVPGASMIALFVNPNNPRTNLDTAEMQAAARGLGKQVLIMEVGSEGDIDPAFSALV